MSELSKRYEELVQLRAKATPGPWTDCYTKFDGLTIGFHVTGPKDGSLVPICEAGESIAHDTTCERLDANAALIVAAVNFLDSLPALKKEWEREARLAEAKWWSENDCKHYTCPGKHRLAALATED